MGAIPLAVWCLWENGINAIGQQMNTVPYKTYLTEGELPSAWYNVRADMKVKPAPLLNPQTLKPVTAAELEKVFCKELGHFRQAHRRRFLRYCAAYHQGRCM